MGLLKKLNGWRRKLLQGEPGAAVPAPLAPTMGQPGPKRIRRFERLERRDLLSASPLHFGAVYYEDAFVSGTDNTPPGDLMAITFAGGADGSQLTTVTIELDPLAVSLWPMR